MVYMCEFELYENDGCVVAWPFEMGEGTFGDDIRDAVESAVDWLRGFVEGRLMRGEAMPEARLGHTPEHGGRIVVVAVECSLERIDAVAAAEAARLLGVSAARVSQMCEAGRLESWKVGSKRMVTRASIEARLADAPRPGRPRKGSAAVSSAPAARHRDEAALAFH